MYALVNYSGNQILIKEGEQIKIPFTDKKVGSKLIFDNILFIDDGKTKKIGNPYIKSLSIDAKIISHGKDKKVIVFKKKRRKGYQRKNGHRQNFTLIQVDNMGTKKITTKKTAKSSTTAKKTTKSSTTAKKTTKSSTAKKKTTKKSSSTKNKE